MYYFFVGGEKLFQFTKKFIGFSIGPIIGAIISFITVPVTSNLISPDQFGMSSMFNLANTIITLIVLIGIDQAYMREYNECTDKRKLLFNCMLIPFINTFVVAIIMIVFREFFSQLLFDDKNFTFPVILLAICTPLFIIEKFLLLSIRMEEKALKYSLWNILSKLFNLIALVLLLLFYKRNFESVIYATILSQLITSLILCFVCRNNIKISTKIIDKMQLKKVFKFGLPLVPATLIGYGLNSMDTIFLRIMSTYEEIGYYSVALRIANVLGLLQTSFTSFWSPVAFKWKKNNVDSSKYELVSKGVALGMSLILIGILLFKNIIPYILSEEYEKAIYIFPFLLFYPIFYTMSETTTLGISFSRKTGYNVVVSASSLIVNLILNTILIPIYGAIGAAIATGLSYLVFFWARTIISRKLWYKMPIKHFVITTITLLVIAIANVAITNLLIISLLNLLAMLIIVYNYRDIVKYIFNMIKEKNRRK